VAYLAGLSGDFFGGFRESTIEASSVVPKVERRDESDAGVVNVGWFVRVYFNRIVVSSAPEEES